MDVKKLSQEDFVREISIASNIGLFLGAGASASSGIPTAYEMILDFKRRLYASEKRIDLYLIYQRPYEYESEIEQWVKVRFGASIENEYGFFFEKCFPSKAARNQYIRELLRNSKESIGYKILAALVKHGLFSDIFTTNFDNLVQKVLPDCVEITENNVHGHIQILKSRGVPFVFKLHGDFREDWLRNLPDETRKLHKDLEEAAISRMKALNGLVVIGYSGRDRSIMEMLHKIFQEKGVFPNGIYWCARQGKVNDSVLELLHYGIDNRLNVAIVNINDFDELMIDIYRQVPIRDISIEELLEQRSAPLPFSISGKTNEHLFIVHNFLPILKYPKHFWVIEKDKTDIETWEDIESVVEQSNHQIILSFFRRNKIIVLGDELSVKRYLKVEKFEPYVITLEDLKAMNKGKGFLFGIYYKIFLYHFKNFLKLKIFNSNTVLDLSSPEKRNGIEFYHALQFYLRLVGDTLYLTIQPDYVIAKWGNYSDGKYAKTALLGKLRNQNYFEHLLRWHKKLKTFGNNNYIHIYGPPAKTVRFVIGSKFMKSLEVWKNE